MKEKILAYIKTWRPVSDRVIVLPQEQVKETETGILTADTSQGNDKKVIGTVLAVGNGRYGENGILIPMEFTDGETVIFSKYAGEDLLVDEALTIEKYNGLKRDEQLLITILRADSLLSIIPSYAPSA